MSDVEVEWAVRLANGDLIPVGSNRTMAERLAYMRTVDGKRTRPGAVVVRREVTPWVPVEVTP